MNLIYSTAQASTTDRIPPVTADAALNYRLYNCTVNNQKKALRALLKGPRGAEFNINAQNHYGDTLLAITAYRGNGKAAQQLLLAGADTTARDTEDNSPLHQACDAFLLESLKHDRILPMSRYPNTIACLAKIVIRNAQNPREKWRQIVRSLDVGISTGERKFLRKIETHLVEKRPELFKRPKNPYAFLRVRITPTLE